MTSLLTENTITSLVNKFLLDSAGNIDTSSEEYTFFKNLLNVSETDDGLYLFIAIIGGLRCGDFTINDYLSYISANSLDNTLDSMKSFIIYFEQISQNLLTLSIRKKILFSLVGAGQDTYFINYINNRFDTGDGFIKEIPYDSDYFKRNQYWQMIPVIDPFSNKRKQLFKNRYLDTELGFYYPASFLEAEIQYHKKISNLTLNEIKNTDNLYLSSIQKELTSKVDPESDNYSIILQGKNPIFIKKDKPGCEFFETSSEDELFQFILRRVYKNSNGNYSVIKGLTDIDFWEFLYNFSNKFSRWLQYGHELPGNLQDTELSNTTFWNTQNLLTTNQYLPSEQICAYLYFLFDNTINNITFQKLDSENLLEWQFLLIMRDFFIKDIEEYNNSTEPDANFFRTIYDGISEENESIKAFDNKVNFLYDEDGVFVNIKEITEQILNGFKEDKSFRRMVK